MVGVRPGPAFLRQQRPRPQMKGVPVKTNRATLRRLLVSVCLALLTAPLGRAQVATGTPPFGRFSGGPDIVNNSNLNVHLSIPIINKAGRGLPFYYVLTYDSSVWWPWNSSGAGAWTPVPNWGWGAMTDAAAGYVFYSQNTVSIGPYGSVTV